MSATISPTPQGRPLRADALRRSLTAEWTKLRTLRSTRRTAIVAALMAVGWSVMVVSVQLSQWHSLSPQQRQVFDPTSTSLSGVMIAAVVFGALGVRVVTGEYATGMIRSTFTAMPSRTLVLAAKAATVAGFVFPITLICEVVSFALGQHLLAGKHLQVAVGDPGVMRAMLFGALAVSLVAVIGVGVAGVIRHTAGATTTLVLLVAGGLTLGQLLPAAWRQYVPGIAAQAAVTVHRSAGLLRPTVAIGVLAAYAALALGAASIRVARRDA